ncbi:MAG TPA: flagellar export protein FliJ [Rhodanobacteraceae bacterium]|nr:flagellar export protein FliJ [Rhodanobacteraceae bacterium]
MNTPRSQRLQRVADIAGKRTDEAATALAERLRNLDAARRRLQELQQFRRDYQVLPDGRRDSGTSVSELLNRQSFIARIDTAIAQQQCEVAERTRQFAQARTAWLASRCRSAALDTVTQRYRSREQASLERAEQAAIDDRMQYRKAPRRPS